MVKDIIPEKGGQCSFYLQLPIKSRFLIDSNNKKQVVFDTTKEDTGEKVMDVLLELLINFVSLIVIIMFLVGLVFVVLISVVYIAGYVYDSIFGNSFISLGHFIGKKYPKIKNIPVVLKMWKKIQLKELYLRYETPLFAYCFSYTAISLLALIWPNKNGMSIIAASALYLLFYFVGMARKCGSNEQYYTKMLDNNMEFLKLSFLPLGFIITVLGFCFTITGMKVQELPFDFTIIVNTYTGLMSYNNETNTLMRFLKMIASGGLILILFYIVSLPVQVVSYFVISVINYFRKHKAGYIELFKKYLSIIIYFNK